MNQEEVTYIYTLVDPKDNLVKYVGKSDKPNIRLKDHIRKIKYSNTLKNNWLRSLLKEDLIPKMEIIDIVPISEWSFWESYWISQYRSWGFILKNGTNGGEGGMISLESRKKISESKKGFKHSEESKQKMSDNSKGFKLSCLTKKILSQKLIGNKRALGLTHSEEFKQKMRDRMSQNNNPMYGNSFYKQWVKKYGKEEADKKFNDFKNKLQKNNTGKKNPFYGKTHSDEFKQKMWKKVKQLDLDGNLIKIWDSITEAAKSLGMSQSGISNACIKNKKYYNYKWLRV